MEMTAGTLPPRPVRRRTAPGIVVQLATLGIALVALDAMTAPRAWNVMVMLAGAFAVVAVWLTRLPAAVGGWSSLSRRERLGWLVVPALVGVALLGIATGAAATARFELSRGALDRLVADRTATGATAPDWVGLYDVDWVGRGSGEVMVTVGGLLDELGFVWFPGAMSDAWADEMCGCDPQPLGGGWWTYRRGD
ncbi:MAG: hypothetical protein U0869_23465 [Chloroflexota bacterium]